MHFTSLHFIKLSLEPNQNVFNHTADDNHVVALYAQMNGHYVLIPITCAGELKFHRYVPVL